MSGNTVLCVNKDELSSIHKWYGRSKQDISNDLKHIRNWLSKQPHLPQDLDDHYLEKNLRMNKYSLEKTKKKLDMYFSVKNVAPEFYDDRDLLAPTMQHHMDHMILVPLPRLTSDLTRVHVYCLTDTNSDKLDFLPGAKFIFTAIDLRLCFEESLAETFIIDMKNFTIAHVLKQNPVLMKKGFTVMQQAYCDRIKSIHILNMPSYAQAIYTLAISVLSEKIAKRVHVHKDTESLLKFIPKEVLPVDYGGTEKSVAELNVNWRKLLEDNNKWLMEMGRKRSVEKLRQGPTPSSELFESIHGSFRQLTVD